MKALLTYFAGYSVCNPSQEKQMIVSYFVMGVVGVIFLVILLRRAYNALKRSTLVQRRSQRILRILFIIIYTLVLGIILFHVVLLIGLFIMPMCVTE